MILEANPDLNRGDRLHPLIQSLKTRARFDHPVESFEILETHISYVLLTGPYAYKFKKPVNLGFLDFSTLEKRKLYCEEELRLNRRLAPELYCTVVPVTGSESSPELGGSGPAIEYCVKMVQFRAEAQLDQVLERGQLTPCHIDELAAQVAHFHQGSAVAGADAVFGTPAEIGRQALENFAQIGLEIDDPHLRQALVFLCDWTREQLIRLNSMLSERKRTGRIRACHGDMHLTNMALVKDRIVIFDCIEFNESLYWIDVTNDIAFLLMDLDYRGRSDLAYRFLNRYLERTGDYEGLALLNFYRVYRTLVRAKVAHIQYRQLAPQASGRQDAWQRFVRHVELARRYTEKRAHAPLIITHGLSGSGKTWLTEQLVDLIGAIRLRSDVERKRLYGLEAEARSHSRIGAGLYEPQMTEHTYARLRELARRVLMSGFPVIVDATFLKRSQRQAFRDLASELGAPLRILSLKASEAALRERIIERQGDASEANLEVLDYQLRSLEPLTEEELKLTVQVDTEAQGDLYELTGQLIPSPMRYGEPKARSRSPR